MKNEKVDILAFGVHPDDIELACAGTILKHIDQGKSAGIVDFTQGELGTRGSGPLRLKEAEASAQILGVEFRYNLGMKDGFFRVTQDNIRKVITSIRRHQPDIILANSLEDRHPDHGRAAQLVQEAAFYSGLIKIDTEGLPRHRPTAVYHYIQDKNLLPDFVVDVSPYVEKKFQAISAFSSQFFVDTQEGPQTPISSQQFMEFLRAKMRTFGRSIQVDYAEGFNVSRTPGVGDLFDLL